MRLYGAIMALVAVLLVSGCKTADAGAAGTGSPLVRNEWQLREFRSSDDAIGVIRPKPSETYRIRFNADGSAALVLACNRGRATWEAQPSSQTSGSLAFKAPAMTLAMCLDATMDSRLARDLPHIASYLIKDGELYLSLWADGGQYVFAPE